MIGSGYSGRRCGGRWGRGLLVAAKIPEGQSQRYDQQSESQLAPRGRRGGLIGGLGGVSCGIFWLVATAILVAAALPAALFSAKFVVLTVIVIVTVSRKIVAGNYFVARFAGVRLVSRIRCGNRSRLTDRAPEIRQNGLLLDLTLAQGGEIVGYGFFFVEPDLAGVGADETFIENPAGELVEVFVFQGAQHASADLRGVGDGVEFQPALLALFAKFFSEGAHALFLLLCARNLDAIIIGEGAGGCYR